MVEIYTKIDIFTGKPLSTKVYLDIKVDTSKGISTLHNLTEIEAVNIFGKKLVDSSINDFTKIEIPKLVLIERLNTAKLFSKAIKLLKASDKTTYNYEIFNATQIFYSNDRRLRIFLKRLGGNVDELLAPID